MVNQTEPMNSICSSISHFTSIGSLPTVPPILTIFPPRRTPCMASSKVSSEAFAPSVSSMQSAPSPPVRDFTQSAIDPSSVEKTSIRSGASAFTRSSRSRFRPVPKIRVDAHGECEQRRAEPERAGDAVDQHGLAGDWPAFLIAE